MKKTTDYQFLIRVIKNQVSPLEQEYFERWLGESEKHKEEFSSLLLMWEKLGDSKVPNLPDNDMQWQEIERHLDDPVNENNEEKENKHFRKFVIAAVAASVVLVTSLVLLFYNNYTDKENAIISKISENVVETGKGEKIEINLNDGSKIILNSMSKFFYPDKFSDKERIVRLEGEAYFIVKHIDGRSFKVLTKNSQIVVTGTEFNIKSYNKKTEVIVTKGSVNALSLDHTKMISLKKGDAVSIDDAGNFVKSNVINTVQSLKWKLNDLNFSSSPLEQVMKNLEEKFKVKVVFENEDAKKMIITGKFNDDSLDEILSAISLATDINIIQKDNTIFIK